MTSSPVAETISIFVPFRIVQRGGRRELHVPAGTPLEEGAAVKALARAFRWKRLLDSGECTTIGELAEQEGVAASYVTRLLRLTLLAPDIVENVVNDTREWTVAELAATSSELWTEQRAKLRQQS